MLRHWLDSLVNRAVLLVILAIFLTAIAVTLSNSLASRQELRAQAEVQVTTIAELVASELDRKLSERLEILAEVASYLTMEQSEFEQRAQRLADRQVALRHLFDAFFLFDLEGGIVGEYPQKHRPEGLNVSSRDYFQRAASELTSVISEPYVSFSDQVPAFMLAVPVFDHNQRFIGVLGGAIRLNGENFMADVASVRVGHTGYVGIGTRSGITLAHGRDGSQILQPVPSVNEAVVAALDGYEGTRVSLDSASLDTLISIRQLNEAPWFVAVIWPLQEAFAPTSRLADMLVWVLSGILLVLVPIMLLGFRRLLSPLTDLAQQITERHLGLRSRPVRVGGGREIREVADTFNIVMDERSEVVNSLADREAFFRSLSQSAPIGILQADVLGRIEFVNPAFEVILGIAADDIRYRPLESFIHEAERRQVLRAWRKARAEGHEYRGRMRLVHQSGAGTVWVDVMTAVIGTADKSLGTIVVARDITHELEVEEELRLEQKRAESILSIMQEGVLLTDGSGRIRYANQGACEYLGVPDDCEQQNFFDLMTVEADGDQWDADRFLAQVEVPVLDAVLRNADGQQFDVELTMLRLNPGGEMERLVFVLRDDSERRRHEERLSWEASHDSLTGLLNRRAFSSALSKWLGDAADLATPSVLMLIDLDHFKPVNDQGGHLLGDEMLRQLAGVFTAAVRQSDVVGRLGGDEFGVILPACGLPRAETLAEDIRAKVEALVIRQDDRDFSVTASIGLTELSAADSGPREATARADEGCYAAKAQGRNKVVSVALPPEGGDPLQDAG